MPHEPPLTLHPVATAEQGKIRPPDAPGLGMDRGGAGGAVTAAEVVQRDDKEMSGVDGLAGTNIGIPPARAPVLPGMVARSVVMTRQGMADEQDRKSTRLNSSHVAISYAVFCLKKKRNSQSDG